jgi:hypothetical protein
VACSVGHTVPTDNKKREGKGPFIPNKTLRSTSQVREAQINGSAVPGDLGPEEASILLCIIKANQVCTEGA